jgi:3-dehydroquinate synthase
LLAIVDGSIGGKVALNMPQGKNLIGAFHAPLKVLICNDFLTTLSDKEWMSGKGEVLKYGFLSKEINQMILSRKSIEDISLACAEFKNKIVEKDFKESGDRILLNLGHTLGHAFEVALDIPHGQAVIMGMKYLFKYMEMEDALDHWEKMLKALDLQKEKFDLKDFPGFDRNRFFSYLDHDKKKSEGNIRLVLVREIGQCYVEEMSLKDFKTKIQSHADFKD